jgi:hypothetical protein
LYHQRHLGRPAFTRLPWCSLELNERVNVISRVSLPYRRSPVDRAGRTDQDRRAYSSAFFVEAISCRKKQIAESKRRTQIFATHGFHFFATSSQPHHFPSTRLRLSHSSRAWPGDYGDPGRSPNVYSYYQLRYARQVRQFGSVSGSSVIRSSGWQQEYPPVPA